MLLHSPELGVPVLLEKIWKICTKYEKVWLILSKNDRAPTPAFLKTLFSALVALPVEIAVRYSPSAKVSAEILGIALHLASPASLVTTPSEESLVVNFHIKNKNTNKSCSKKKAPSVICQGSMNTSNHIDLLFLFLSYPIRSLLITQNHPAQKCLQFSKSEWKEILLSTPDRKVV